MSEPTAETTERLALGADSELAIFGGKGGVGKTTCAASAALDVAERRDGSHLLMSTDPAHSILDTIQNGRREVPSNLTCREFDSASALESFRDEHRDELETIVRRGTFFEEDEIRQLVDLSLPGMDEVMALLELADLLRADDYDTIVLDTAPTGHTVRLLELPDAFERWIDFLDLSLEKHRYMKRRFGGRVDPDAADAFLEGLREDVSLIRDVLGDPARCRFTVVARPEDMNLSETDRLLDRLDREGISARDVLFNGVRPDADCPHCRSIARHQRRRLHDACERFEGRRLWRAPAEATPPRGPERLVSWWRRVDRLDETTAVMEPNETPADSTLDEVSSRVEGSLSLPIAEHDSDGSTSLLFVSGKGGVGKTTMASALASAMADGDGVGDVLVFSTDPAHSLGDCFDREIGSEPVSLGEGLSAAHLDAESRFGALKEQYRRDIESLFEQLSEGAFDLTYDRPVVERLMEMAPPGIDEIMGWVAAMEWADERAFDCLVLDTAPTGHFLRLLEMPDLFDEWLKMFFRIKLEHKRYLKLPELSERLVSLSKQLKRLRRLMRNATTGNMVGIVEPSGPAIDEGARLVSRADEVGLATPSIIVNRTTPSVDCTFCEVERERQRAHLDDLHSRWPERRVAVVPRGDAPRGRSALNRLGNALLERRDASQTKREVGS